MHLRGRYLGDFFKKAIFYSLIAMLAVAAVWMRQRALYSYEMSDVELQLASEEDVFVRRSLSEEDAAEETTVAESSQASPSAASSSSEPAPPVLQVSEGLSDPQRIKMTVQSGETLGKILQRHAYAPTEINEFISALSKVYDPARLKQGQSMEWTHHRRDPSLHPMADFRWRVSPLQSVVVQNKDGRLLAKIEHDTLVSHAVRVSGMVRSNFMASARASGLPPQQLNMVAKLLSYNFDLQRDVKTGDRFDIVFETYRKEDGTPVHHGDLLYANVQIGGKTHVLMRHISPQGKTNYYTQQGHGARSVLLRTPVSVGRVSSTYGTRMHPVLGYTRDHLGVDFAAPHHTPILAAGHGVVSFIGFNSSYGNYLKVTHNNKFTTLYAHASKIKVKKGDAVKQGEVIAYVGSTGLATGPHLHYEVHAYGVPVNPLNVKQTQMVALTGDELRRFRKQMREVEVFLAKAPPSTTVAMRDVLPQMH
jgi:murein DD-endopeptidase MepM/ murein hydrolase activator NlpD